VFDLARIAPSDGAEIEPEQFGRPPAQQEAYRRDVKDGMAVPTCLTVSRQSAVMHY